MASTLNNPKAAPRAHARRSPSGLKSLRICPGYLNDDSEISAAGEQGTRIHSYVEHEGDEKKAATSYQRESGNAWSLSEEEKAWGDSILEYLGSLEFKPAKVLREVKFDLRELRIPGLEFGTCDRAMWESVTDAHVLDWKFGWLEVDDVRENLQFKSYCLGLWLMDKRIKQITMHMCQPKLNLLDVEVFTRDEHFDLFASQVRDVVERADKFDDTKDATMLNLDETNCGYCARQGQCPVWQSRAAKAVELAIVAGAPSPDDDKYIDELSRIRPEDIPALIDSWDPAKADPVRVAQFMVILPALEKFLNRFKRFALDVHVSGPGRELPEYSIVESSGKSTIVSILDAKDVAVEKFRLSEDEFIACCEPSLTKLKEAVAAHAERGQKGKLATEFMEALTQNGILTRGSGYSYLKRKPRKKELAE